MLANLVMGHGLAVIARHQTAGTGRNNNQVKTETIFLEAQIFQIMFMFVCVFSG